LQPASYVGPDVDQVHTLLRVETGEELLSIGLDLTKDEHRDLRVAAALADMSMAAYCRKVVSEAAEKVVPKAGKGGAK
jgi:hypothetical protein